MRFGSVDWSKVPADWTELIPELEQQSGDLVIDKGSWGAFIGTSLHGELKARGVTATTDEVLERLTGDDFHSTM